MSETLYAEDYLNYQTNRSWLRKTIRKVYLWQVRRHVVGKAIDFGCGVGEHLAQFPAGSVGLEVNEATVKYCRSRGMNVEIYNPEADNYDLKQIPAGQYQTLVISHVLEHLPDSHLVLKKLMDSCTRLGIKRIFICVPCKAGFAHDKTHVTFVTKDYVKQNGLESYNGWQLKKAGYFPFNLKFVGDFFTYNELNLLYEHA